MADPDLVQPEQSATLVRTACAVQTCPPCGYDLRGSPASGRCPECGFEYSEGTLCFLPSQPLSRQLMMAGAVFVLGALGVFGGYLFDSRAFDVSELVILMTVMSVIAAGILVGILRGRRKYFVIDDAGIVMGRRGAASKQIEWREIRNVVWHVGGLRLERNNVAKHITITTAMIPRDLHCELLGMHVLDMWRRSNHYAAFGVTQQNRRGSMIR